MVKILIFALISSSKSLMASPDVCVPSSKILEEHGLELEQFSRDNLIPKYFQKRWEFAKKVKFPLHKVWGGAGTVDYKDFFLFQKLSTNNRLAQRPLGLGKMMVGDTAMMIEAVIEEGGETTEVILNIQGRKYWVELHDKKSASDSIPHVGTYRTMEKRGREIRIFSNEEIDLERKAWLNGPDGIGELVETQKGKLYRRVDDERFRDLGPSWRDEETGFVWSNHAEKEMTWEKAMEFCKKRGGELPTKEMFEDLISKMGDKLFVKENGWWWSSSPYLNNPGGAWVLDRYSGDLYGYGYNRYNYYSVRCMAR